MRQTLRNTWLPFVLIWSLLGVPTLAFGFQIGPPTCDAPPPPNPCSTPVQLSSVLLGNTSCGGNSGLIIIDVEGGNSGYSFQWTPAVSTAASAFDLVAGAYHIVIKDIDNANCQLDTTIIVTNSSTGNPMPPEIGFENIQPAHCLAANGALTATSPQNNVDFAWSDGFVGAARTGLAAGCYIVTATRPNGCYQVQRFCLPAVNPLVSTAQILDSAKCGQPTGSALIEVEGGTGPYIYSFTNNPLMSGLAAGTYGGAILDQSSCCRDTLYFIIPEVTPQATINIVPHDIRCPGELGNVEFTVIPGPNFVSPHVYTLTNMNGVPHTPGSLPAGMYVLRIIDGNNCVLPADTFEIKAPPSFSAQLLQQNGSCADGGTILLNPTGGNGPYVTNWLDLPGFDNPEDRFHLAAGYYSVQIFDSLFCRFDIDSIYIPRYCAVPETLSIVLPVNTKDTLFVPVPVGVAVSSLGFSLLPSGTTGSSAFGSWVLNAAGRLIYTAGSIPGFKVDKFFIRKQSTVPGFSDTVIVAVTITDQPLVQDSVFFALQAGDAVNVCASLEPNYDDPVIFLLNNSGLNGTSDSYGIYSVNPFTACLTFQSNGPTGYNIDHIEVAVCDTVLRECQLITYIPTVLFVPDCFDGVALPDTIVVQTDDCEVGLAVCLPVPFGQIFDYVVVDRNAPYSLGYTSCLPDTVIEYTVALPGGGPFRLTEWLIDGQNFTGYFTNIYELANLVNLLDPGSDWSLQNNAVLLGGNPAKSYGPLQIVPAVGDTTVFVPVIDEVLRGTQLTFLPGEHLVVFRRLQTGCQDSVVVLVECLDCPPFHTITPDINGVLAFNSTDCDSGAVFCTSILNNSLGHHTILVDGVAPVLENCPGNLVGIRLDTGSHTVFLRNLFSGCEDEVSVKISCQTVVADTTIAMPDDTTTLKNTTVQIPILTNDLINGLTGNTTGINSVNGVILLTLPSFGTAAYDPATGLLSYTPGNDRCEEVQFDYQIKDTEGRTSSTTVTIDIRCDRLLVYNGLSPNGDGANDIWRIDGIEEFPKNEVRVFNRWGNLVFEQKAYSNDLGWDGQWNGKYLPDGAYFYVIDLGNGSAPISGYMHIMR